MAMRPLELSHIAWHFARTRWGLRFRERRELEAWQQGQIRRFLRDVAPRCRHFGDGADRRLETLPVVDKDYVLRHFAGFNCHGITLDEAMAVALAGERSRDFRPTIAGLTVGLSSGTSGTRGVFLVSPRERAMWAGIMLARVLSPALLRVLLAGRERLRVAFFLRANSNLYSTVSSRRIDFRFHDLFQPLDGHGRSLQARQPHVLVAPARVLRWIADEQLAGRLSLRPSRVISVAETLEPDDAAAIRRAFGAVHQVYQCTEGFLGYTCDHGTLHLNEEYIHVEPEWLDAERTRFVPVVTDFTRSTQMVVRYRLNDVLRVQPSPCACGSASLALAAIEGRSDDVLWLRHLPSRNLRPVFPDQVRHAMLLAQPVPDDYRIEQRGDALHVAFTGDPPAVARAIEAALGNLCRRMGLALPVLAFGELARTPFHQKRRRIVCVQRPGDAACAS
jgi:putative adenylate-forming enzyme